MVIAKGIHEASKWVRGGRMRHDIPGVSGMANQAMLKEAGSSYNPTLRERLLAQKADLTQRLADVNNAISALDSNPNFEDVLNVIGKVNY